MTEKQRVSLFLDGSNFFFKLRDPALKIPHLTHFNYRKFAEKLAHDRKLVFCGYYVGVVRAKPGNTKGQKMRIEQRKLFNHLISPLQKFVVRKGYIMENNGVYHEKGVDVQLAVDLLVGAYEDKYDVALIVSSDTDLVPAIEKVQALGKQVEYIGFAHQPSFGMQRFASLSRLLIKEDIEPFIAEEKPEEEKP